MNRVGNPDQVQTQVGTTQIVKAGIDYPGGIERHCLNVQGWS